MFKVVVIHMASRTYARDGTTESVEARGMIAPSCVEAEEGNIGFMRFEV